MQAVVKMAEGSSFHTTAYRPFYAIDGLVDERSFVSKPSKMPWLEVQIDQAIILERVIAVNKFDSDRHTDQYMTKYPGQLQKLEVRAGEKLTKSYSAEMIDINDVCGYFAGPGKSGERITFDCAKPIAAKYVTFQLLTDNTTMLNLAEIMVFQNIIGNCHNWYVYIHIYIYIISKMFY